MFFTLCNLGSGSWGRRCELATSGNPLLDQQDDVEHSGRDIFEDRHDQVHLALTHLQVRVACSEPGAAAGVK